MGQQFIVAPQMRVDKIKTVTFFWATVRTVLKLYFNINQLENQQNNYNLLILINSYKKLSEPLFENNGIKKGIAGYPLSRFI